MTYLHIEAMPVRGQQKSLKLLLLRLLLQIIRLQDSRNNEKSTIQLNIFKTKQNSNLFSSAYHNAQSWGSLENSNKRSIK